MARVKRGSVRTRKRSKITKAAKGYSAGRKNTMRLAKTAVKKAGQRAFDHRKLKKRTARALWQIKINAAVRQHDMSYSVFMDCLKKKNIEIDRKILADMAENNPDLFAKVVETVKAK
ncbi:MAG: 50S ribosomal protein L20 [Candidatus Kerfeldbacteria bacterium]